MIRILMLTHNMLGVGGSFMRSHSMAKGLHELGHEVTLLVSSSTPRMRVRSQILEGPRVIEFPDLAGRRMRHGGLSPIDVVGRMLFALRSRVDIVHGFDHRPAVSLPSLALRRRSETSFVADWGDLWGRGGIADLRGRVEAGTLGAFDHYWERATRKWADGITCVSESLGSMARDLGVPQDRIRVIPAGSNIDVIRPIPKDVARRNYGIDLDAHVAVYLGHSAFDEPLLAESFLELVRLDPRALLITTGPELPLLSKLASDSGISSRMAHLGYQVYRDLGEILACGDVMLLPYTSLGANKVRFPNRVGDYLAAGRPIVTNPTGDVGMVVADEKVGLVADENPRAFAEAVVRLFRDRQLREEFGRRARQLAESRYEWRKLAGEVERLYTTVLSS